MMGREDKNIVQMPYVWGKNETSNSSEWRRKQAGRVRRHTRLVVFLRIILPSVAAVLVGLIILWPQLKAQKDEFSLVSTRFDKSALPENQVMVNPRLFVVDSKNQPMNFTAKSANEIAGGSGRRVRLDSVQADVVLANDAWVAVDAKAAEYSQESNTLELQEQVNLYSDRGYELETTQAVVDINNKNIFGKRKTTARGRIGTVDADGFGVYDKGARLMFTGRVKMVLYPQEEK